MTQYVVFAFYPSPSPCWVQVGAYEARSSMGAIRAHLSEEAQSVRDELQHENADISHKDRYAAIPLRSWKPVTVKVETKTALKFS